jgi:hypothetical protein
MEVESMISVDGAPRTPPHRRDRDRDKGDDDDRRKDDEEGSGDDEGAVKKKSVADGAPGRNLVAGIAPNSSSPR